MAKASKFSTYIPKENDAKLWSHLTFKMHLKSASPPKFEIYITSKELLRPFIHILRDRLSRDRWNVLYTTDGINGIALEWGKAQEGVRNKWIYSRCRDQKNQWSAPTRDLKIYQSFCVGDFQHDEIVMELPYAREMTTILNRPPSQKWITEIDYLCCPIHVFGREHVVRKRS